jgi:transposase
VLQVAMPPARASTWAPDGGKLAPFRDYLARRLAEGCGNAVVLAAELRPQGYSGQLSILRDVLRPQRQERRRQPEATVRYETGPGKQAQVEWGAFGRIWTPAQERWQKLYGFVYTRGYSRAHYLEFTTSCDLEHLLACHLGAFRALGIADTLLYDNLKTAILGRRPDGTPLFPGRFLDIALYAGFTAQCCQPYRAQTKGKVERTIRYVRENFWVRVAAEIAAGTLALRGLNARATAWADEVANQRVHGTHGEVVWTRYRTEAPLLGRLEGRAPYDPAYHAIRRVGRAGPLSYRGVSYQVPLSHALRAVQVDESLRGEVTLRARDGARLASVPVGTAGPPDPAGAARAAAAGAAPTERLTVGRLALPSVPLRDLAIYQEVADAVGLG